MKPGYFNNLFVNCKSTKILRVLLKNRKITNYNEFYTCICDELVANTKIPPTLATLSIIALHKHIVYRIDLTKTLQFVNFIHSVQIIENLLLPKQLKENLLYFAVNCPRHTLLCGIVPKSIKTERYVLKPTSSLYMLLQQNENWNKEFNHYSFHLTELISEIMKCHDTTLDQNYPRYNMLYSYVKLNCKIIVKYDNI